MKLFSEISQITFKKTMKIFSKSSNKMEKILINTKNSLKKSYEFKITI